jgi:hypothetical protein
MIYRYLKNYIRWCVAILVALLFVGSSIAIGSNENDLKISSPQNLTKGTYTFNPTDDSRIDESTGGPPGDSVFVHTRNHMGGTGHYFEIDALIKFDISTIPSGTQIESAVLYLYYVAWDDTDPGGRPITIRAITSDWNEETVEWVNQPTFDPTALGSDNVPDAVGLWMQWDVTSSVQKFIDGTAINYGWRLSDDTNWGGGNIPRADYSSKEAGQNIPYLEVMVNEPPEKPQITGPTSGKNGQSYDYTFITSDTDADQVYYTIEWGDGQNNTWIGPYTSGQPVTIPHTWAEKGTYTVKAKAKDTHDAESNWTTLDVTMPYSYDIPLKFFWERFFIKFPNAFAILRFLLKE